MYLGVLLLDSHHNTLQLVCMNPENLNIRSKKFCFLKRKLKVYGVHHFQQYISYIMAVSFIGGGNWSTRRKPTTCRNLLTNFITQCCIKYTSPWTRFELTLIGNDCTGSCQSNYHMITTTTIPNKNTSKIKTK